MSGAPDGTPASPPRRPELPLRRCAGRGAWLALALASLLACSRSATEPDAPGEPTRADAFAFVSVTVVPMDAERALPDRTVLVRDGVITAVAGAGEAEVPEDAVVIDGAGLWLMPALADMHVHVSSADLEAYVSHGIATVRNMWGFGALGGLVDRIEAGELVGPRVRSLSPGIDGPPPYWPETQLLTDPALADSMVQVQADRGYDVIKVYNDLTLDVYDALVAAATSRGMRIAGHVPRAVPIRHALAAGQASVEHLSGFVGRPASEWPELAALAVAGGTRVCPTLSVLARGQSSFFTSRLELAGALHAGGVPLLVGTDAGIGITAPGVSIHEELGWLAQAGLTPYEALLGATRHAAAWFGEEDAWGTVAPGMRADLLLLAADPLASVTATEAHVGILRGDQWTPLARH